MAGIKASVLASQGLISKQTFNSRTANNNNNDADLMMMRKKRFLSFCLGLRRGATLKPSIHLMQLNFMPALDVLQTDAPSYGTLVAVCWVLVSLRSACVETGRPDYTRAKGIKGGQF